MNFLTNLDTPTDFFAFFLALAVVFVNGFTDAPNSVQSSVKSGALSLFRASLLSGFFNFIGVLTSSFFAFSVGKSVLALSSAQESKNGSAVVCACLLTVIFVGVSAWVLKMPSSESHALIFSLMGACLCATKSVSVGIFGVTFIVFCMFFSSLVAYILSRLLIRCIGEKVYIKKRRLTIPLSALSFMHGAQDGQKLLAILIILSGASVSEGRAPPLFLVLIVGTVLFISTVLSGKRILGSYDKLSENSDTSSGFFADCAAFFTLFICSLLGMPVSTGNVKSAAVFATEKKPSGESKRAITWLLIASFITLPVSFLLGFVLCKILLLLL